MDLSNCTIRKITKLVIEDECIEKVAVFKITLI